MSVAVSTILARASKLLLDEGLVRWTQAELIDWGSEGQVVLVQSKDDAKIKTATVSLVSGSKQSNPADCLQILDMRQNNGGAAILPCDRTALDRFSQNWMVTPTASTVKHWMPDQQYDTFYVYPAQNTSPAAVVVTYKAMPTSLTAGGNIDIRDVYADNLVNYIVYRAFSKEDEVQAAQKAAAYLQLAMT